uniref:Putative secreted peptide n=1 Tax=Anopheles braziliensis TaxID=58242 RepID=A0A2M3ZVG7_9DIPT
MNALATILHLLFYSLRSCHILLGVRSTVKYCIAIAINTYYSLNNCLSLNPYTKFSRIKGVRSYPWLHM